jgi:hypothetical protein
VDGWFFNGIPHPYLLSGRRPNLSLITETPPGTTLPDRTGFDGIGPQKTQSARTADN